MVTTLDKVTALLLIDLQNSTLASSLAHDVNEIMKNVNDLANAFRQKKLPVVIVNVNPAGAAWTKSRKQAKQAPLPDNDDWYKITDKLHTHESDVHITKHTWNAFFETELHHELKKRSVTGIVLAGVSTSIGVEGTARAASELGYNIAFATNAITDTQLSAHERSLQFIFPRLGETATVNEIIRLLKE